MNALKVVLLLIVVVVFASMTSWPLLVRIAYLLAGLLVLSFIWSLAAVRGIRVRRDVRGDRAQVGQAIVEHISITNLTWLPRLWLELRDHSTLPGHEPGRVIDLGPKRTQSWTNQTLCHRRGEYTLGPVTFVGSDPFGLFIRRRLAGDSVPVLVYPDIVEFPGFAIPSRELPGGERQSRGGHQTTAQVSGIRDYAPGDPLSRIHWLSTARQGRLITKEFEFDPAADVWLVLDAQDEVQRGTGNDSTEEYAVTVAASLAQHFLQRGRAVGLATHGTRPIFTQPDRGPRQLQKILERLAVIRADGEVPLGEVILSEALHLNRHTTVVAITPSLDDGWVVALQFLEQRGVKSVAVLVEPGTFGGQEGSLLQVSALAAAQVPTILVKRGDDLAATLAGQANTPMRFST
jgi:uncharacterized protein (DUF58 family)